MREFTYTVTDQNHNTVASGFSVAAELGRVLGGVFDDLVVKSFPFNYATLTVDIIPVSEGE